MSKDDSVNKIKNFLSSENTIKGIFIASVASISALVSFSYAFAAAKKRDTGVYDQNVVELHASGARLALRALKWGTFYAVSGCGLLILGVWTLANVKDIKDLRQKIGSIFPPVPKNNPPQSRTDFKTISELLQYLDDEYSSKPSKETNETDSSSVDKIIEP